MGNAEMNPFLLSSIIDLGSNILDRVIPDKAAAERAKLELAAAVHAGELQVQIEQIRVNAEEAKSPNWAVAGARPFILWTCGAALCYAALLEPFARFIAVVLFDYAGTFPVLDTDLTMQVLFGILGLGAFRSAEKIKGAEGNR